MPRLLLHFARFGPYHHARLRVATEHLAPLGWEVIGLETAGTDLTYAWDESLPARGTTAAGKTKITTVFADRVLEDLSAGELRSGLSAVLNDLAPDAVAVAGWGSVDARLLIRWCRHNEVKVIVMSETREADGKRVWWKEKLKSHLLRGVHGALVGGASHRDYLVKLGIPTKRIQVGYNVVDNAFFAAEVERWRFARPTFANGAATPYFLASNRFIARKNLERLIDAYARYARSSSQNVELRTGHKERSSLWNLCLLGDGPLRSKLFSRCRKQGLTVNESAPWENTCSAVKSEETPTVYFPGFRQIGELPRFYAHADCFVHPALEEPWGLVINEAMASGLPVLSGRNVGAAEALVEEGRNGWTFDAFHVDEISEMMIRVVMLSEEGRAQMGRYSATTLEERSPTVAFATGLRRLLSL